MISTNCEMLWAALRSSEPILMWTGSSRQRSRARRCTSLGHVADQNSVCRSGRIWLTILRIWRSFFSFNNHFFAEDPRKETFSKRIQSCSSHLIAAETTQSPTRTSKLFSESA